MSSFYTCVTKITIIRYKVPEYRVRLTEFFVILGHFLPFYHPANDPQNQNFEEKKNEKNPLEILPFYIYMCVTNEDHMIYGSSNIRSYDIQVLKYKVQQTEIFVILDHFLHFYPPNNPKNQNFEDILEILSFYTCVPKIMIICYTVPEM